MQTIESGAKYPLVNGRHEFSDGSYVEISNGNHIMLYKSINGSGYINISDISQNSDTIDNQHHNPAISITSLKFILSQQVFRQCLK